MSPDLSAITPLLLFDTHVPSSVWQVVTHKWRCSDQEHLIFLKELIESWRITAVSDRTYPLSEVPEALGYLQQGHDRENVVITVKSEPDRSIHRSA